MNVLVACEFSGVVRDAFVRRGHKATSCDILPSETPGAHYHGNVMDILQLRDCGGYDLMIAFPHAPIYVYLVQDGLQKTERTGRGTGLCPTAHGCPNAKNRDRKSNRVISTRIRKPDQIIQPWQFGHGETKSTCLWLKNLPRLVPTDVVSGRSLRIHYMSPGPERAKNRSRTYTGIAKAMAEQWG